MARYFKNKGPLIVAGLGAAGLGFWMYRTVYPTVSCLISNSENISFIRRVNVCMDTSISLKQMATQ